MLTLELSSRNQQQQRETWSHYRCCVRTPRLSGVPMPAWWLPLNHWMVLSESLTWYIHNMLWKTGGWVLHVSSSRVVKDEGFQIWQISKRVRPTLGFFTDSHLEILWQACRTWPWRAVSATSCLKTNINRIIQHVSYCQYVQNVAEKCSIFSLCLIIVPTCFVHIHLILEWYLNKIHLDPDITWISDLFCNLCEVHIARSTELLGLNFDNVSVCRVALKEIDALGLGVMCINCWCSISSSATQRFWRTLIERVEAYHLIALASLSTLCPTLPTKCGYRFAFKSSNTVPVNLVWNLQGRLSAAVGHMLLPSPPPLCTIWRSPWQVMSIADSSTRPIKGCGFILPLPFRVHR